MKKLFIISACIFLASCSKEVASSNYQHETNNTSTTIPLSDALIALDDMMSSLAACTKSENTQDYSMEDILSFGLPQIPQTKAGIIGVDVPDTLMYIVNFKNEQGFAVLSADTRLGESVYCLTENGTIGSEDFIKAMDYLHSDKTNTKSYGKSEDTFKDIGHDFVPALILSSMLADIKYGLPKEAIETKATPIAGGVLLKTKWHQGYPFNKYTPYENGRQCPAGCVAIACAQIMQYCKKPADPVFNGVSCSWNTMETVCNSNDIYSNNATSEAKEQVARFLIHIGKKSLCYIRYHADGSGGYADGVVRTLKHYGYSSVRKTTGFGSKNQSKASEMLRKGLPVYLNGSDYHNGGGHAWVIDGEWNGHFHCNWGWNGKWDGYYAKHNYFPISSRAYLDNTDPGTTSDDRKNDNYDWNFRLITYSL